MYRERLGINRDKEIPRGDKEAMGEGNIETNSGELETKHR
jgi:hypothetical protein